MIEKKGTLKELWFIMIWETFASGKGSRKIASNWYADCEEEGHLFCTWGNCFDNLFLLPPCIQVLVLVRVLLLVTGWTQRLVVSDNEKPFHYIFLKSQFCFRFYFLNWFACPLLVTCHWKRTQFNSLDSSDICTLHLESN